MDANPEALRNEGAHDGLRHESAELHVTGQAKYADDIPEPDGMVHCYLSLSSVAAGDLEPVDLAPARASPGVLAVLSADDIPGENDTGPVVHDEPLLVASESRSGQVHFAGQPLFLVVAASRDDAVRAAKSVNLNIVPRPPILSIDDALAKGSFLSEPYRMARGDAATALETAEKVLSGQIEIGGQEHFYLEGQVAVATPGEGAEVHVVSSNQHPSECQIIVGRVLGRPSNAITVEVRRLGGGFGGKETQGNAIAAAAALAAVSTGRPAKLRLDRDQDIILTGKRHEFRVLYRVGFDRAGRISGIRFEHYARCGWSTDLSHAIADRAMFHADNCYFFPAVEIVSHRLKTNTVSNTAFRGFGGPQGMVGVERVIEHIAAVLDMDPLEVRRRNFYNKTESADRAVTPYHMEVEDFVAAELMDELVQSSDYQTRRVKVTEWNRSNAVIKRGIALTPVKFGISFTTTHLNQAGALVHVYQDGSVLVNHGGIEMGQGLHTKILQVAASALGVPYSWVRMTATRTDKIPNTSATAASSGADLNGMAVARACATIMERLSEHAARTWSCEPTDVEFTNGKVLGPHGAMTFGELVQSAYLSRIQLSATGFYATPDIHWDKQAARGRPFLYFAYGAAISEVAVDTLTGEHRVLRVDILHDAGRSLNPAIDLGQVEGGFVQGAGWLLMEELVWDDRGRLMTHAPSTYKIPCASDRPPVMNISLWEKGCNSAKTIKRSKAVGEPPLMLAISAFEAVRDAVSSASGIFTPIDAPATPESVLEALARTKA